jgi:hypothetical protein
VFSRAVDTGPGGRQEVSTTGARSLELIDGRHDVDDAMSMSLQTKAPLAL